MQPDAAARPRGPSLKRVLYGVLVFQMVLGLAIVATEFHAVRAVERLFDGPDFPDGPVRPGDQRRRFEEPSRPLFHSPDPARQPGVRFPSGLPERLEFTEGDTDTELLFYGKIAEGDAARVTEYLDTLETAPETVRLNSPGGVVGEAQEIGRTLRAAGIATRVAADEGCYSSCPYILAGGTERRVDAAAEVGVHQHYFNQPGYMPVFLAVEEIQRGQGATMEYLDEMGIDPMLLALGLSTPPDAIYVLLEEELLETALATEVTGAAD